MLKDQKMSDRKQNYLIFLYWIVYTVTYLGKYSYNANINLVMEEFSIDHATAGLVTTFFFFAYGAGQIIHAFFCKYYPKRILAFAVLLISGGVNFLYYIGVPFGAVKYMWLINAFALSTLWPSIVLMASRQLDDLHNRRFVLVISTTTPLGTLLAYGSSMGFVQMGNYRLSFLTAAIVLAVVAVLWLLSYRADELPQILPEKSAEPKAPGAKPLSKRTALVWILLICLGIFAIADNAIKDGLQTWVPSILKETYHFADSLSIFLTLILPLLGMFGAMLVIQMQKKIPDFVNLCALLFGVSAVLVTVILLTLDVSFIPVLISFGILELIMHGIANIYSSIAPIHLRRYFNSGLLAGILNGCGYIGSTFSSYGLGSIADAGGWNAVFILFLVVAGVMTLLGVLYALLRHFREKRSPNDAPAVNKS